MVPVGLALGLRSAHPCATSCRLRRLVGLPSLEAQARIDATKSKRVAQRRAQRPALPHRLVGKADVSDAGHVAQNGRLEVYRRWRALVVEREHGERRLDRASRTEQMAGRT